MTYHALKILPPEQHGDFPLPPASDFSAAHVCLSNVSPMRGEFMDYLHVRAASVALTGVTARETRCILADMPTAAGVELSVRLFAEYMRPDKTGGEGK